MLLSGMLMGKKQGTSLSQTFIWSRKGSHIHRSAITSSEYDFELAFIKQISKLSLRVCWNLSIVSTSAEHLAVKSAYIDGYMSHHILKENRFTTNGKKNLGFYHT